MIRLAARFEQAQQRKWTEDRRRRRERLHNERERQERKEKAEDRNEEDAMAFGASAQIATDQMIAEMTERLEKYREANTRALMENTEQRAAIAARIASALEMAFILPDGRRAFRSEDGTFAVDEFGQILTDEDIDLDAMPETGVTAEDYLSMLEEKNALDVEQAELLEYQEQLDAAEEALEAEGLTEADLDAMDADLMTSMPSATRAQVGDMPGISPAAPLTASFSPASRDAATTSSRPDPSPSPNPLQ